MGQKKENCRNVESNAHQVKSSSLDFSQYPCHNALMHNELHEVQAKILRELLFNNGATFSSLNTGGLSNDHFTFHIKQLIKNGTVEKKDNLYFLTQAGKQYAGRLDVFGLQIEKFGTPSIAITAKKIIDNTEYFLLHERLKEPMYGKYGFINGKIKFGEFAEETAKRELFEESSLTGNPKLVAIHHRLRGPNRKNIKLDHFFFLFIVDNPIGTIKNSKEGNNYWKTIEEAIKLPLLPGFKHSLEAVTANKPLSYLEEFIRVDEI